MWYLKENILNTLFQVRTKYPFYLQTKWDHYESESDEEDMEVDEGDDSDDMETTLPSIDDVLDTETWRRKQQLHKQQSNVRLNFLVVSGMMLLKILKH